MERPGSQIGGGVQDPVTRAAEILRRYGKEIRAMIRFVGCRPSEQDDAFQQLFLTLLTNPPPADVRDLRSYLYKAILNDQITRRNSQESYRHHLSLYAARLRYMLVDGDPAEQISQAEQLQQVYDLIERLPRRQAEAISMAFGSCTDRQDACERMGIQRQSFSKYLWRGLRVLRLGLQERMGDHGGTT
ncbi:MAG: sigma-70 family RNA polymerase sigma factor [Sedimentisphaerales bacterium]|nr:sigma-70 family RNA polymerase sigma factor [Sedimentisphaerales bacterium]